MLITHKYPIVITKKCFMLITQKCPKLFTKFFKKLLPVNECFDQKKLQPVTKTLR